MGLGCQGAAFFGQATEGVILLDTHALIWLHLDKPRARALTTSGKKLFMSPISLLELGLLVEVGKIGLRHGAELSSIADDPRWRVDSPPSDAWMRAALDFPWTRDPFDRLLVAHARLRRWKLATADTMLLENLRASEVVEL